MSSQHWLARSVQCPVHQQQVCVPKQGTSGHCSARAPRSSRHRDRYTTDERTCAGGFRLCLRRGVLAGFCSGAGSGSNAAQHLHQVHNHTHKQVGHLMHPKQLELWGVTGWLVAGFRGLMPQHMPPCPAQCSHKCTSCNTRPPAPRESLTHKCTCRITHAHQPRATHSPTNAPASSASERHTKSTPVRLPHTHCARHIAGFSLAETLAKAWSGAKKAKPVRYVNGTTAAEAEDALEGWEDALEGWVCGMEPRTQRRLLG